MKFLIILRNLFPKSLCIIQKLQRDLDKRACNSGTQSKAFAIYGLLNYPIYYLIWMHLSLQTYENFLLRTIATVLCLFLSLKNYWPAKAKSFFPLYWYITLIFCVPFFFNFMMLKNNCSPIWLMIGISTLFWTTLLVDFISSTIIFFVGSFLAIFAYIITTGNLYVPSDVYGIIAQYIGVFVVSGVFAHNKENVEKSKLEAMRSIGASIAHELRTPLAAISMGVRGAKKYFPVLLGAYQIARENNIEVADIPPAHLKILLNLFDNVQRETHFSNLFIDMLLQNVNQNAIKKQNFEIVSMNACIKEALQRYPFTDSQKNLIKLQNSEDFKFSGSNLLIVHTLFNLIKNALHQIEVAGKGRIYMWCTMEKKINTLHFKDTATGIPLHKQDQLFRNFISNKRNGTGLGLTFCKMVMHGMNGEIRFHSVEKEYTEFLLSFPTIKDNYLHVA